MKVKFRHIAVLGFNGLASLERLFAHGLYETLSRARTAVRDVVYEAQHRMRDILVCGRLVASAKECLPNLRYQLRVGAPERS